MFAWPPRREKSKERSDEGNVHPHEKIAFNGPDDGNKGLDTRQRIT